MLFIGEIMYYVYVYFDQTKSSDLHECGFEPFYVGKGKNERSHSHLFKSMLNGTNKHKCNKIRKLLAKNITPHVVMLASNLTEDEAFTLEKEIIKKYGRHDLKLGPLTNATDGGEGSSNKIFTPEYRKKLSDATRESILSGKRNNDAWKYSRLGKKDSDETKEKRAASLRGKCRTVEAKANMSRGQKQFRLNNPDFKNSSMLGKHHSDETKAKLSASLKIALSKPETKELRSKVNRGANNPRARPVTIFSVNYDTIGNAFIATGLTRYTMMKDPSFSFL